MKNILYVVLVMLSITTAQNAAAESKGEMITNKGYAFVCDDQNTEYILQPGLTSGQWKNVLKIFTQKKFGEDLEVVLKESTVADKATGDFFWNTYWNNGAAMPFGPVKTIPKAVLVYRGQPWLVVQCAQMISTDAGLIREAIREGMAQYQGQDADKKNKTSDDQLDKQETKKEESDMTTAWIILALVLGLGIIAATIAIVLNARNHRAQAQADMMSSVNFVNGLNQTAINNHYNQVGQFQTAANQMNLNAALNAQQVHATWTTVNQPPAGGPGGH